MPKEFYTRALCARNLFCSFPCGPLQVSLSRGKIWRFARVAQSTLPRALKSSSVPPKVKTCSLEDMVKADLDEAREGQHLRPKGKLTTKNGRKLRYQGYLHFGYRKKRLVNFGTRLFSKGMPCPFFTAEWLGLNKSQVIYLLVKL